MRARADDQDKLDKSYTDQVKWRLLRGLDRTLEMATIRHEEIGLYEPSESRLRSSYRASKTD